MSLGIKSILLFLFAATFSLGLNAQNNGPAVGQWKSIFSYFETTSAAYGDDRIYCGTTSGFFVYDIEDNMTTAFSKVSGMSDVEINKVAYDPSTKKVIIGYANSNLDVFHNSQFTNIPDIKISTISGDKTINHISAIGGKAYISTPIGLIVADLDKAEISFTTTFFEGSTKASVSSTTIHDGHIFAATSNGIYRIELSNNLMQDYTKWEKFSDQDFLMLASDDNSFYGMTRNTSVGIDSVYKINNDGSSTYFYTSDRKIRTIDIGTNPGLWIGEEYKDAAGSVRFYNSAGIGGEVYTAFFPNDIIELGSGRIFFAERDMTRQFGGLREISSGTSNTISHTPDGPESTFSFDVWAYNGELWVAHGGHGIYYDFLGHTKAFSAYRNNEWKNFASQVQSFGIPLLSDACSILKDRRSKKVYVGMAIGGMIEVDENDQLRLYRDTFFGTFASDYVISGIAQDQEGNIWFSNYGADKDLRVKTTDDNWYAMHPTSVSSRLNSNVIIDDYGYKWYGLYNGGGAVVFDDNGTLNDPSDDRSRLLRIGEGNGNLPSATIYSLAKDNDNTIWIGTNDGIGIVENPEETLKGNADASIKIVSYDDGVTVSQLFKGKSVTAIAVDGSNKKWVGTSNQGVWLISEDANEMYQYFHTGNSPLPSNDIKSIDIDPVTGDVYISTAKGLVAYRGEATVSTGDTESELFIYPNPVPTGYEGMIAIKGLVGRSEVRITDVAGQLVAQFTTEGGQAVWNGKDYTGRRPQTGVYLVMVTDQSTGKTEKSGKIIFNE